MCFGLMFGKRFFDIENILAIRLIFTNKAPYVMVMLTPGTNLVRTQLVVVGCTSITKMQACDSIMPQNMAYESSFVDNLTTGVARFFTNIIIDQNVTTMPIIDTINALIVGTFVHGIVFKGIFTHTDSKH